MSLMLNGKDLAPVKTTKAEYENKKNIQIPNPAYVA
jgi:hypothetical protein